MGGRLGSVRTAGEPASSWRSLSGHMDWREWHRDYADPDSALGRRLLVVQMHIRAMLDRAPPGPIRAIAICAGQGLDLIGALVDHPRRDDLTARLVEFDEHNVALARKSAQAAGLRGIEPIVGDASVTDAYRDAVPADLILLCGVFGNISEADIANTINHLPQLSAMHATVIWTRHRHPPDLTPFIRETFDGTGFDELAFVDSPPFGVGADRLRVPPRPFQAGVRLFEFVGYDVLAPDFHATRHAVDLPASSREDGA